MSLRHIAAVASVFKTGTDWLREKCACLNFRTVTFGAGWQEAKLGDKIETYCNIEMFKWFVRRLLCDTLWIWGLLQITTAHFMLVHSAFLGKFCLDGSSNARLLKMPQRRQKAGRHGKQRGCTMLLVFAKLIPRRLPGLLRSRIKAFRHYSKWRINRFDWVCWFSSARFQGSDMFRQQSRTT